MAMNFGILDLSKVTSAQEALGLAARHILGMNTVEEADKLRKELREKSEESEQIKKALDDICSVLHATAAAAPGTIRELQTAREALSLICSELNVPRASVGGTAAVEKICKLKKMIREQPTLRVSETPEVPAVQEWLSVSAQQAAGVTEALSGRGYKAFTIAARVLDSLRGEFQPVRRTFDDIVPELQDQRMREERDHYRKLALEELPSQIIALRGALLAMVHMPQDPASMMRAETVLKQ